MMPIQQQPPPADFDVLVRQKGQAFLHQVPAPTEKEWKGREYWREALPAMRRAYQNICAYCAQWISTGTGTPTIDHYLPKSLHPHLAYEWSNFRLASLKLNSRKRDSLDVLDPFTLSKDWFILDFTSFMILPHPHLSQEEQAQVWATLERLKLNADEEFVESRYAWFTDFKEGEYPFTHLERRAPFIAYELQRQGLVIQGKLSTQ